MKIAVLSDIHGNLNALEKVLGEVWEQEYDKVLMLGDYALAGPLPQETVVFIRNLAENDRYVMIQGNTDKMIAGYTDELYEDMSKKYPVMANALRADVEVLSDRDKAFLASLEEQKELELNGVKILMVHGSPRRNDEDITSDVPIKEVEKMLEGVDADLILCGHTHIPCGFQTETNQTVINAGSVGRPFTSDAMACYVTIEINDDKSFEVKHNFVNYDINSAVEDLKKRGFDGVEKLAQILVNPDKRHV